MMIASAAAKIILLGEHAVVYGVPAIAIPVSDVRVFATVKPEPLGKGLCIAAEDLNQILPVQVDAEQVDNALLLTVKLILTRLHAKPPDATIAIRSQIPPASGLGSGAAVSTALGRALCMAIDQPLAREDLNAIVYEVEKMHHGTPSGIDNTVIVYERPVYYVRDQAIQTFSIGAPIHLLIADTGQGALTKIAVGAVRDLYNSEPERITPILDAIRDLVIRARAAIEAGEIGVLGSLMNDNHAHLRELTVSSNELDQLVDAARQAGALGAKLSGGGRGGNMIALVTPETRDEVERALLAAGAVRVIRTTLEKESA